MILYNGALSIYLVGYKREYFLGCEFSNRVDRIKELRTLEEIVKVRVILWPGPDHYVNRFTCIKARNIPTLIDK